MKDIKDLAYGIYDAPKGDALTFLRNNKNIVGEILRQKIPHAQTITHQLISNLFAQTIRPLKPEEVDLIFQIMVEKGYARTATVLLFTGATKAR